MFSSFSVQTEQVPVVGERWVRRSGPETNGRGSREAGGRSQDCSEEDEWAVNMGDDAPAKKVDARITVRAFGPSRWAGKDCPRHCHDLIG